MEDYTHIVNMLAARGITYDGEDCCLVPAHLDNLPIRISIYLDTLHRKANSKQAAGIASEVLVDIQAGALNIDADVMRAIQSIVALLEELGSTRS